MVSVKKIALGVVLFIIAIWLLSGIYIVHPNEEGVIRRWGRYYASKGPGIHYHIPWPVERVDKPPIAKIQKMEIGFKTMREILPDIEKIIMAEPVEGILKFLNLRGKGLEGSLRSGE